MRRFVALAPLSLALASCAPPPRAALGPDATAFVNVSVVPLDSERVLPDQTVVTDGGRIVAMGPSSSLAPPPGARVIDAHGKYLMPGLTDMHVHITREEDLYLWLARGVTTVRNMWGTPLHLVWRDRVARGVLDGPAIYTAGPIVDGERPAHDGSLVVTGAEDADRAVALHQQAGYDFVKVYSRLSRGAFEQVVRAARGAGLPVAGHVPREVGFAGALDAGQITIEHLDAFDDALQADGSPLAGKYGGGAQEKKIDHVDPAKIAPLVQRIRDRGAWICPTRNLLNELAPPAELKKRLERPEMRFVPGYERAVWTAEGDLPEETRSRRERTIALGDRLIKAARDGGAKLLVGTDTGNPYVIPGYTLHEEMELFVRAGLTPYEVLRAATRGAAELMHAEDEVGTVAVGKRADLLLLDGNPLADVKEADRIAGVMARGRWFGEVERAALLARVEAWAQGKTDPFAGVPPLGGRGEAELEATYLLTWKGVPFDHERVRVERLADGRRVIRAQTIDPHKGQWTALHLAPGARRTGHWMELETDGANGRGKIEVTREGGKVRLKGTLMSGFPTAVEAELAEGAKLGAEHFLAGKILLGEELIRLDIGKSLDVEEGEVSLGSYAKVKRRPLTILRLPDAALLVGPRQVVARRYEMTAGKGKPDVLWLDERGFPLGIDVTSHGVSLRRISP